VLLVFLFFHPLALLLVGCCFESETADVEEQTDDVGKGKEWESREGSCGDRVESENREKAEGYPGCLGEEGSEELGRRSPDLIEAGVAAVF
jgi:hypothetical protein